MIILPLVGVGNAVGARYPGRDVGSLVLPPILPHDPALYAQLRRLHTVLAYLFFFTIIVHFGAALLHALIIRDGVFHKHGVMAPGSGSREGWRRGR